MKTILVLTCMLTIVLVACTNAPAPSTEQTQVPVPSETATSSPPTAAAFPTSSMPLETIAGKYSVTLTAEALLNAGALAGPATSLDNTTWVLNLAPDGGYKLMEITDIGERQRVQGIYSISAELITFKEIDGATGYTCLEAGVEQGMLSWSFDGDQLNFKPAQDECEARVFTFTALPWVRQP